MPHLLHSSANPLFFWPHEGQISLNHPTVTPSPLGHAPLPLDPVVLTVLQLKSRRKTRTEPSGPGSSSRLLPGGSPIRVASRAGHRTVAE